MRFPLLFSPLAIKNVVIPNRIGWMAHNPRYRARNAAPVERELVYLEERVKNGVGLVLWTPCEVAPPFTVPQYEAIQDEKTVPQWAKIPELCHRYSAKVFMQLTNNGKLGATRDLVGASVGPSPLRPIGMLPGEEEITHELDKDEIKQIEKAYATGALNLKRAGYDGVELRSVRGMLLSSFMSPAFNQRSDEYGGNTENRLRLHLEIAEQIRSLVGRDFVVGIRFDGDEYIANGTTLDEAKKIAQILEASGYFDFLELGQGAERAAHVPSMYFPLGAFIHLAAEIRRFIKLPIIAGGRINDPVMAEQVLKDNLTDIVGICRALIADPEWVRKTREDRIDEIRKCVACNEGCLGTPVAPTAPVSCAFNPEAGREKQLGISLAQRKKRVVVVGGGPAGCEAARVATLRGHQVILFEKENELGGQLNVAGRIPDRVDLLEPPRWYTTQLKLLGVDLRLETLATTEAIKEENPDVVIIATGSALRKLSVPGVERSCKPDVVHGRDVLLDKVEVGTKVVIVDTGHHIEGLGIADFLADRQRKVELLVECLFAGAQLDTATLPMIYTRVLSKGVIITPLTTVKEIEDQTVVAVNKLTELEKRIEPVDTVVFVDLGVADDSLYYSLKGYTELYLIGDALAPRRALQAVWDAARVARQI